MLARRLDLVALAIALPIFILGDLPLLGWVATTAAWIAQSLLQRVLESRAATAEDMRQMFGYVASSLIGRSWLLALTIFGVGIVERSAGLAAAVLALIVFTLYLLTSFISRPSTTHTQEPIA